MGEADEEPAHGVGPVTVQHLVDIRVVLQRLGHLVAVRAEHDAVRDHVFECRAVEQGGAQHVHRVEPAPSLANVFNDEVRGVVGVEPFLMLHRVMHLGIGHRTGVEPYIQDVFNAAHHRCTGWVIGVWSDQFVDPGAVQVDLALGVAW